MKRFRKVNLCLWVPEVTVTLLEGVPSNCPEQWVHLGHCSLVGTTEHGEDRMADAGSRMRWVAEVTWNTWVSAPFKCHLTCQLLDKGLRSMYRRDSIYEPNRPAGESCRLMIRQWVWPSDTIPQSQLVDAQKSDITNSSLLTLLIPEETAQSKDIHKNNKERKQKGMLVKI